MVRRGAGCAEIEHRTQREDEERDPDVNPLAENAIGLVGAHQLDDDAPQRIPHDDEGRTDLPRLELVPPLREYKDRHEEQTPEALIQEGGVKDALHDRLTGRIEERVPGVLVPFVNAQPPGQIGRRTVDLVVEPVA
jgi:hypothetical protein